MNYNEQPGSGPSTTPNPIRYLLLFTALSCVICALIDIFIKEAFHISGPLTYLSLSGEGMSRYFLWQPLTYFFVYGSGEGGIDFYWMAGLALTLYILWITASHLYERLGIKHFFILYFASGIIPGLIALLFMPVFDQYPVLSGQFSCLLGLMTGWVFLNPTGRLFVFRMIPIEARAILVVVFATAILLSFSNEEFIYPVWYTAAGITAYLYALLVLRLKSPYKVMENVDSFLVKALAKIKNILHITAKEENKIYDIRTGEPFDPEDDDLK